MAEFVITGDTQRHGGMTPPVLVWNDGKTFVFVHPSQIEKGVWEPVRYATRVEAESAADQIPCPLEIAQAQIDRIESGLLVTKSDVQLHPGLIIVRDPPAVVDKP